MQRKRLFDLGADRAQRIERHERALHHEAREAAAYTAPVALAELQCVPFVDHELPRRNPSAVARKADQAKCRQTVTILRRCRAIATRGEALLAVDGSCHGAEFQGDDDEQGNGYSYYCGNAGIDGRRRGWRTGSSDDRYFRAADRPQAAGGKDAENGARLAIDDLNKQNVKIGGRAVTLKLASVDDQADPKIDVQVAQSLVDRGVAAVMGPYNSGVAIPASRIYSNANVPLLPTASNPALTKQGFKNIFRIGASDSSLGGTMADFASQTLKVKTAVVIDDRTAYG